MTATDELRSMLDERGVEWSAIHNTCTSWQMPVGNQMVDGFRIPVWYDGTLHVECVMTPTQAIETTLGRGTCRRVLYKPTKVLACSECGAGMPKQLDKYCFLHFCPNCGRRVVAGDES